MKTGMKVFRLVSMFVNAIRRSSRFGNVTMPSTDNPFFFFKIPSYFWSLYELNSFMGTSVALTYLRALSQISILVLML